MLKLSPCADVREWDALIAGCSGATVFHRRDWLELIAALSGAQLRLYRIEAAGGVVGAAPLFLFRRGPFRVAASPPPQAAAPYLGPLVSPGSELDALVAMAAEARHLGASYFEARLERELSGAMLAAAGFEAESRSTYVLDLAPGPDELWNQSLNASCRRAVRKAQSSDVVVEEVELESFVDRYTEMATSVFAKSNRKPPLSAADYRRIARLQAGTDLLKVFAARHQGEIVAAGIFPYGNGSIYYLDGASDPAGQAARPNNLLHWEVIQWACKAGLQHYDMVGAGISGVARFKETFGPRLVPYSYTFRVLRPMAGLARAAYARLAPAVRAVQFGLGKLLARRGD